MKPRPQDANQAAATMDEMDMFSFDFFRPVIWAVLLALFPLMTHAAALDDVKAVPHLDSTGREGYRDFLNFDQHRAFAIAPGGAWAWKGGEANAGSASRNALQSCRDESGQACAVYALDDKVVFDSQAWAQLWGPYLNRSEANRARTGLGRGDRFYDLAFKSPTGKKLKLSDLRGKVVVLHFWGSWCPSCRHEMPDLQKLQQALGSSGDIRMVLLQVRESFDTSRQWANQQRLDLPLFNSGVTRKGMDALPLADGNSIPDRDVAAVFPATFVLDKHGIVLFANVGSASHWPQLMPQLQDAAMRSGK